MTLRKTAAALKTRLEEDSILNDSTFEGTVINRPNRYLSLFLSGGQRTQGRFTGPSSIADYTLVTHSVGTTPEQSQLVEERAQSKLVDWRPVIPGFDCRRVVHASSQPMDQDTDVTPPLYFIASSYSLTMEAVN
jgi:hypothetical protein